MTSFSTVAAWFLAIAHFGATVAGQSVMGPRPCSTSQCWLSIPMWNLTYSWGASPSKNGGSKDQGSAACVRCALHPLPLPLSSCLGCIPPLIGLPFLRFYAVVSSLFLLFAFSIFFCLSRRCPLLASFLSVLFCLLSLLVSERCSGLISFGSVYLVTTAGFVADQLMWDKQHCILYIIYSCLFKCPSFSTCYRPPLS